jgi:hypothetical protein
MQKILHPITVDTKPYPTGWWIRLSLVGVLASALSTQAMAFGGSFDDVWASSAVIGLVGVVLLGLDGLQKQFETRAFFGVLLCVAAGLTVGHSLNSGRNNGYVVEQNATDAAVAAAPSSIDIAAPPSDVVLYAKKLKLGLANLSEPADEGIDLPGTGVRVYVSCFHDITVHIASDTPLPDSINVTIEAPNLQPSTRQADDVDNQISGSQFERKYKMDTRCDLMNDASIVVQGLKFDSNEATPPKDGKVWITLNKK